MNDKNITLIISSDDKKTLIETKIMGKHMLIEDYKGDFTNELLKAIDSVFKNYKSDNIEFIKVEKNESK